MVLEKTLESPLDCKEIQPVHPKGGQSWVFIGRTMLKLKLQYFGHLMRRVDSSEKTLMLGGIGGRYSLMLISSSKTSLKPSPELRRSNLPSINYTKKEQKHISLFKETGEGHSAGLLSIRPKNQDRKRPLEL